MVYSYFCGNCLAKNSVLYLKFTLNWDSFWDYVWNCFEIQLCWNRIDYLRSEEEKLLHATIPNVLYINKLPPKQAIRWAIDTIHLNTRVIGITRNNNTTIGKLIAKLMVFINVVQIRFHIFEYLLNDILVGLSLCVLPRRNW